MTASGHAADAEPAAREWSEALASLKIPDEIIEAAPEPPYVFDVELFVRLADEALAGRTPSQRVALEALPAGGSVLDVGCGGGAGSLPLAPPAGLVVGVDEGSQMLSAFAERAAARQVAHLTVEGRWPDVADHAPPADVVVCHNVLYNVPDIGPFLRALTDHARTRVVVEITERHPLTWMNPLWKHVHGLDRPDVPAASQAVEVARELGYGVAVERWERPRSEEHGEELLAMVRRRLCVGPDRDPELRDLLERFPPPRTRHVVTMWWAPQVADPAGRRAEDPARAVRTVSGMDEPRKLHRSEQDRMVAGVCGGLAAFLGLDATVVRVLFVVVALLSGGAGLLVYLAMWLIVPRQSRAGSAPPGEVVQEGVQEVRDQARRGIESARQAFDRMRRRPDDES